MNRALAIFLLLLLLPLPLLAQPVLLPPDHPAYAFLERMETLGLLDHPLLGSQPVPRGRIAELLAEVHNKTAMQPGMSQSGQLKLSRVDRQTLAALRWEFSRDAERVGSSISPAPHPDERSRLGQISYWMTNKGYFLGDFYRNGLNFYSVESSDVDLYFDPRGAARLIRQESDEQLIAITAVGISARGYVNGKLGFQFNFLDNTERGREPYLGRAQLFRDNIGYVGGLNSGEAAYYDVTEFDLAFGGKFIPRGASSWDLHAVKMPLRWGPGQSGQLLLSDWGPSFQQIQLGLTLGSRLRLVYLFGSLKTYPELNDTLYASAGYFRTIERSKYIAAHRLEWDPHARLRFAFSEAVIFGERDPELAYLIPLNFFHSAQHDLGDEDNSILALDAAWIPYSRWKFYGQLLIDDITFPKLGTDYYGNKLGWLGGLSWMQPLGLQNFDAALEIAQLRPFIYSHQYPVNVYQNWTSPLGYRYPPNSETVFAALRFRPHRRVQFEASGTRLLHGANTDSLNAGGDLTLPLPLGAAESAPFLGGLLEKTTRLELSGSYEALEHLYLWGKGSWMEQASEDLWEMEVGFRLN